MARVVSIARQPVDPTGKKRTKGTRTPARRSTRPELVHRFLIVLIGTDPVIWRRIEVPETYSFWDLHVAIQDAMGWLDCHLHEFRLLDAGERQVVSVGIPTGEEPADRPVLPGWQVTVSQFFDRREWHSPPATYAYDFGDDWQHVVVHEGLEAVDKSLRYPRCVSGEGRCPPEDCGGPHGYVEFLLAYGDPNHEEHEAMVRWAGKDFDAKAFNPAAVKFDDPKMRWKKAFGRSPGSRRDRGNPVS